MDFLFAFFEVFSGFEFGRLIAAGPRSEPIQATGPDRTSTPRPDQLNGSFVERVLTQRRTRRLGTITS